MINVVLWIQHDPLSTSDEATDCHLTESNKERFLRRSVHRKTFPWRPLVYDISEHDEAGEITKAVAGINEGETFSIISRLLSCSLRRPHDILG